MPRWEKADHKGSRVIGYGLRALGAASFGLRPQKENGPQMNADGADIGVISGQWRAGDLPGKGLPTTDGTET